MKDTSRGFLLSKLGDHYGRLNKFEDSTQCYSKSAEVFKELNQQLNLKLSQLKTNK